MIGPPKVYTRLILTFCVISSSSSSSSSSPSKRKQYIVADIAQHIRNISSPSGRKALTLSRRRHRVSPIIDFRLSLGFYNAVESTYREEIEEEEDPKKETHPAVPVNPAAKIHIGLTVIKNVASLFLSFFLSFFSKLLKA